MPAAIVFVAPRPPRWRARIVAARRDDPTIAVATTPTLTMLEPGSFGAAGSMVERLEKG